MTTTLMKPFLAATLVLATVISMTGCTRTEERITERTTMPPTETEVTAEDRMGTQERPVTRETQATNLNNLRPGQPMSYYTNQFESMGYQVMDIDRQSDRVVYDLGRGNEMQRVTLVPESGTDRIAQVETVRFTQVATDTQDQATQNMRQQIEKMAPGKNPVDYISSLSKLGTVNEYHRHRDYATVSLESGKKHYKVRMEVNPSTQKVTEVSLDRNIWEMPS